jgi:thioredoxin 1
MASENIIDLTESTFEQGVKNGLTLVDFWAEWCAPCKALAPSMSQLASDYQGRLTVAKVDIDSNPTLPARFGIRGIPTVVLFRDGQQVDMFVGNSPQKIKEMVERAL